MNIFIAHISGTKAELTPEESWHCSKVLRRKAGDTIQMIDGKGNYFDAQLEMVSDKLCIARIITGPREQKQDPYYLHLAVAPTKQIDRIEWMLEKAVEIGVHEISFFVSAHSERRAMKLDRIKKIVESAVKQSLQARIPKINELCNFKQLITSVNCDLKFIAHCNEGLKTEIRKINFRDNSSVILVGPEGDFSQEEIDFALQNNYKGLHLGENRLRSETAALYVTQAVSLLTGARS